MFCKNCGNEIDNDAIICWKCGTRVVNEEPIGKTQTYNEPIESAPKNIIKKIPFFAWFLIIIAIVVLSAKAYLISTAPIPPEKLKCVKHKGLCIAKRDVEFDYRSIKHYSNYHSTNYYHKWEAAQRACQAWGGRLPHIDEFETILDADKKLKIRLKTHEEYYSDTLEDSKREDMIKTYHHEVELLKYLAKIIANDDLIYWTFKNSPVNFEEERARCVKD